MTAPRVLLVALLALPFLPGGAHGSSGALEAACANGPEFRQVRIAPDGGALLYTAICRNEIYAFVRDLASGEDTSLGPGYAGDWSPGGGRVVQAVCPTRSDGRCGMSVLGPAGNGHRPRLSIKGRDGTGATLLELQFRPGYWSLWGNRDLIAYTTCGIATSPGGVFAGIGEVFLARSDGTVNRRMRTRAPRGSGRSCDIPMEWTRDGRTLAVDTPRGTDIIGLDGSVRNLPLRARHLGFMGDGKRVLVQIGDYTEPEAWRVAVMRVADGLILNRLPGRYRDGIAGPDGRVALLSDGLLTLGRPGRPLAGVRGLPELESVWHWSGGVIAGTTVEGNVVAFTPSGTILSDALASLPPHLAFGKETA